MALLEIGTRTHPLGGTSVIIGRSPQADVILEDLCVGRRHCEIRPAGDGYEIADLQSAGGTWVNQERFAEWRRLVDGDEIRIGQTVIRFRQSD